MPDEYGKLTVFELRERWKTPVGQAFREEIIRQLQSEETKYSVDWENLSVKVNDETHAWKVFPGVSELVIFHDLRCINLSELELQNANLFVANLEHAYLISVHLEHAILSFARLEGAYLTGAHFALRSWWCQVKDVLNIANYESQYRSTLLYGAELKNVRLDSDPILYRDLLDEQYLDKFAEKHKIMYTFWLFTSNCGRNVRPLLGWTVFVGFLFGLVFADFTCPARTPEWVQGVLSWFDPVFTYGGNPQTAWWQPFYLSFVTMTTLGLASAEPANDAAFWWHTLQNMLGYLLLGYLIAVLGAKFTRRSA